MHKAAQQRAATSKRNRAGNPGFSFHALDYPEQKGHTQRWRPALYLQKLSLVSSLNIDKREITALTGFVHSIWNELRLVTGLSPLCHHRGRRDARGPREPHSRMGAWRGRGWLIEKGEHFPNPITCNVRSVTWQEAGSTWCRQLIVLLGGVLEQRAPETRATHVPGRRHVLGLGGLDYRRDQLGDSVPQDSRVTEMSACADARPFSSPGRAGTSRFCHLHWELSA